jgi:hypothetical protein
MANQLRGGMTERMQRMLCIGMAMVSRPVILTKVILMGSLWVSV